MEWTVAIGVDTHKEVHVAVALGAQLDSLEIPTTLAGYRGCSPGRGSAACRPASWVAWAGASSISLEEITEAERGLAALLSELAPELLTECGVGPVRAHSWSSPAAI